jgi:gliding motility-associated-like protein
MYCRNRLFIIILVMLNVWALKAQTLYWVGGSGNFNDPAHWSLSSGGSASGNLIPSAAADVIFDNQSSAEFVSFPLLAEVKSLKIATQLSLRFEKNPNGSKLIIHQAFEDRLDNQGLTCNVDLDFAAPAQQSEGTIVTGLSKIDGNVTVRSGNWNIFNLSVNDLHRIDFSNANLKFQNAVVRAGDITFKNCNQVSATNTNFFVASKFTVLNSQNFTSSKSQLNRKELPDAFLTFNYSAPALSSGRLGNNQINSITAHTLVAPSCAPGCDGKIILSVPAFTNYGIPAPSTIFVTVNTTTCNSVAGLTITAPGTYTLSNICGCSAAYYISMDDESAAQVDDFVESVVVPNIFITNQSAANTRSLTCPGVCTGSAQINAALGTAPYNFTVTPASGPPTFSVSNGNISQSSLCAGVFTIDVRDAGNCTASRIWNIFTPPTLSMSPVTRTVSCFGAADGGYTITPTGGTPNYIVSFSPGGNFPTSSNVGVSLNGLSPSVISVTLTDSRGCTTTTNTSITQPTAFTVTSAQSTINCAGTCNGSASVIVTGVSGGTGAGSYSYTWSPVAANTATNGTLCAGPASVLILDNILGCTTTKNLVITEIPAIALNSSLVTNVICNGAITGAFSTSIVGGTPNYVATLVSPTATVASVSAGATLSLINLAANNYTLNLLDAAGCTKAFTFAITQPPLATLTAVTQSNTCPGATAGSATLTASGGNGGPWSYTWIGGNSTTATGLATGSYPAFATDVLGCNSNTLNVVITEPAIYSFAFVTTSVLCNGGATGAVTVTPSGGSGPYSYTVTSSLGTQSNTTGFFSGLFGSPAGVGLYTVTVGDQTFPASCAQSRTFSINQPTLALIASASFTNPTCFNSCNAALTGSTNGGGTSPYVYNWQTPTGAVLNQQTLSSRCAGIYTINVVDANACVSPSVFVTVTDPGSITITFTTTGVSCATGQGTSNNGAITTSVSGGTAPYSFTWTPVGPGTASNTANLSNLTAGSYILVYKDNNLCPQPNQTLTINAPLPIVLSQVTNSTSCASLCDGSVAVTVVSGGTPNFIYNFAGTLVAAQATGSFVNVCGPYSVTVVDANNCSAIVSNTVGSPSAYTPAFTSTNVTCFGACNGILRATPVGGITPYTYTLIGTPALTVTAAASASATFTSLCAGTYTLLLADSRIPATCPQSFTTNITEPANSINSTPSATAASCFSVCDGQLAASPATGGTAPFTYSWTSGAVSYATQNVAAACAGTYTLRVQDNNGCALTATTVVTEPLAITITSSVITNVTCNGGNTGSALVNPAGGPSGAYTYNWNPGGQSTQTATNLTAQIYTVSIGSGACSQSFTVPITQPLPIVISQTATPVNCIGNCDGSATIAVVSGGVGTITYSLPAAPLPVNATGSFTNLCTGTFVATVIDQSGCTASLNVPVGTPTSALVITAVGTTSSCASCSGGASVTTTGGTGPYSYVYTNSLGIVPGTSSVQAGLCPGPYTVTAFDFKNCSVASPFTISPVIIIASVPNGTTTCFGASDGSLAATSISGGVPGYSFSWTPSAITTSVATGLAAGPYTLQVTDSSSPINCVASAIASVIPASSITITGSVTNVSCPGVLDGAITVTASGGPTAGAFTYSWSPSGATTSSITNANFGVHTLTVTKGICIANTSFTIGSPNPPITATLNSNSPSDCITPNNGSITVTAGGGDGLNYTYAWTPAVGTTSLVTNLVAGPYQVTITSAGCSTVYASNLLAPLAPSLTLVSSLSVACNGFSTGVLTYSTSASTPSFTWFPANTSSIVAVSSTTANSLAAGTYTLLLSDVNNCTNSVSILVAQSPSLTVLATQTNVACFGGTTGVISMSLSGGTPGTPSYSVNWSTGSSSGGSVAAISGLTASATGAVYTATITDGASCSTIQNFTLTSPAAFTFTSTSAGITCFGAANGSISVTPSPTAGVTFNWPAVASAGFAGSTNSVLTGLSAGIYSVTVSDGVCTAVGINTFQITEPTALSETLTIDSQVSCFGGNNGQATYSVSGGTAPYSYTWTGSAATSSVATNLTAGLYTVTVSDAQGCTTLTPFVINSPAVFDATLTATNPLCPGAFNGSITTQVTGGQGALVYTWLPVGTGQNPVGLSAGAGSLIYTLSISDASLCTVTSTVLLTDPAAISANLTFTNPFCFGNCDGAAVSNPSNTVGTTTITWLPSGVTGSTIGGLCSSPISGVPNIYTVNIADANGCSVSSTFSLTAPAQITAGYTTSPALCQTPNGSITVAGSGGTGALTYSWLPPAAGTTTVVNNLSSGTYTVLITDANNCTNTVVVPVSASNGPTATVASTSLQCFGQCDGSATVTAVIPSTATLLWLPPAVPGSTNTSISGLCVGSYSVEITDPANNCKTYYGVQISAPPVITITTSSVEPTCFGICDGSVSISTAGGTPGYGFNWVGPNGFTSTLTSLTNLCGGDYSLTISDANACTVTPVVSLQVLNNIIIQQPVSVVDNICAGDCLGSATINVVSTTTTALTATVNWNNGQIGNVANNLCTGTYSVLVTDTRGCSNTFSVGIGSAPALSLVTTVVQPDCNLCNGSVSISASGGNGPAYSYTWTTGQSTSTLTNLCAGLYQVLVKDVSNCAQLENVIINNSNGINSESITVVDESCPASCDGSATITPAGGLAPYIYNWINPAQTSTINSVNNLCPGTYFVRMTDANSCVRIASLAVNSANDFTISTFITPPSCTAVPADGSINAFVNGNSGPVTYLWMPGAVSTYSLGNAGPGSYTLTVTDNLAGCTKSVIVNVSNFEVPQFSLTQTNADCLSQGAATVVATGTNALTYLWSTGSTASVVSNLPPGLLTLTVTAANGCVNVAQVAIAAEPEVELQVAVKKLICKNDCNGIITLQPVSGTLPFTFSLSNGSSSFQSFSLCSNSYTASVMDSKGCTDTVVVNLANPVAVSFTAIAGNNSCKGLADGSASLTISGGTAPYSFTLSGASISATATPIKNLASGQYTITVRDSLGCAGLPSTLAVIPSITVTANTSPDFTVCIGTEVLLSAATSSGGGTYLWTDAASTNTLSNTVILPLTLTETQTIALTVFSSLPGCFDTKTVIAGVYPRPYLDAGPRTYTMPVYSSTVIGGNPTSLVGGPKHTWAPAEFLDGDELQNPVASNTTNVTYTVSIVYGEGCLESDTVQVLIIPAIRINSGFSPNDDGKNDYFLIDYVSQFPDNTVEIYNRWGDQVFYSKGYETPWDGTFKGKALPVGTYYYVINLNHFAYPKPITGPITIFR